MNVSVAMTTSEVECAGQQNRARGPHWNEGRRSAAVVQVAIEQILDSKVQTEIFVTIED